MAGHPIVLDDTALRRANPRRGTTISMPSQAVARKAARGVVIPAFWWVDKAAPLAAAEARRAVQSGQAPTDIDAAAAVIVALEAGRDALFDAVFVWLATALGAKGTFDALAKSGALGTKAAIGSASFDGNKWLAFVRWLSTTGDADYVAVRDIAARHRATTKEPDVRYVLDMTFPDEPWATDDARAFDPKRPGRGFPAGLKAAMLLLANTDFATAERLMTYVLTYRYGPTHAAAPAYVLVDRFGARAEPFIIDAFQRNLKARNDTGCEWIAFALACMGSPAVASLFREREGKSVGKAAAKAFARRFPALAAGGAAAKPRSGKKRESARFAVVGHFEIFGRHKEPFAKTAAAWKACRLASESFDDWSDLDTTVPEKTVATALTALTKNDVTGERLRIELTKYGVEVHGVLTEETVARRAVALASLFRLGDTAPVSFLGGLLLFSPARSAGYRLEIYERGESSFEAIDEAADLEDEVTAELAET